MALACPALPHARTNAAVTQLIKDLGYSNNPISGIVGNFFTTDRERDAFEVIDEILMERKRRNE